MKRRPGRKESHSGRDPTVPLNMPDPEVSRYLLETILDSMGEGIIVSDPEGKSLVINESLYELFNIGDQEIEWENWYELLEIFLPDKKTPFPREELAWIQASQGRTVAHQEMYIRYRKQKKGVFVNVTARSLSDQQGALKGSVVIFRNITEQHQLQEQFLHSQKMEAVGRLAGGIAHDFNNLLTIISGYSELLYSSLKDSGKPRLPHYAEEIIKAAQRAGALTSQLLAFSRKQVIQPTILDLNELLTELQKMLLRLIGEDIDLKLETEAGLGLVKADPHQIEQIIMNLAVNARDAMPTGGKLLIRTANLSLSQPGSTLFEEIPPGEYVCIEAHDTGSGISEEVMPHIFEPFYTTKETGKGTGLGLATVYGIVKQYGGYINVWSWPEEGTTFSVVLPRCRETAPLPAALQSREMPARRATLLVVEDEDDLRALVCTVLSTYGFTVLEAKDTQQAQELTQQHEIQLLLTDLIMPGMSGSQLAEKILHGKPGIKVLYMSGYTDDDLLRHGLVDPSVNLLPKPFLPEQLILKIKEVLER